MIDEHRSCCWERLLFCVVTTRGGRDPWQRGWVGGWVGEGVTTLCKMTWKIDGFLQAPLYRSRNVQGAELAYIHMTRTENHRPCTNKEGILCKSSGLWQAFKKTKEKKQVKTRPQVRAVHQGCNTQIELLQLSLTVKWCFHDWSAAHSTAPGIKFLWKNPRIVLKWLPPKVFTCCALTCRRDFLTMTNQKTKFRAYW